MHDLAGEGFPPLLGSSFKGGFHTGDYLQLAGSFTCSKVKTQTEPDIIQNMSDPRNAFTDTRRWEEAVSTSVDLTDFDFITALSLLGRFGFQKDNAAGIIPSVACHKGLNRVSRAFLELRQIEKVIPIVGFHALW